MTTAGVINALIIFAIASIFDILLVRALAITIMSILAIKSNKNIKYEDIIDEDETRSYLLGSLYETYETQIVKFTNSNEYSDE